jgi:hypothetical protein
METKHTPGPWFARKGDTFNPERTWGVVVPLDRDTCAAVDGDLTGFDAGANGRTVVLAEVFDAEADQGEADARLIAAAPDLLAALDGICDNAIGNAAGSFNVGVGRINAARAAIAKARG